MPELSARGGIVLLEEGGYSPSALAVEHGSNVATSGSSWGVSSWASPALLRVVPVSSGVSPPEISGA